MFGALLKGKRTFYKRLLKGDHNNGKINRSAAMCRRDRDGNKREERVSLTYRTLVLALDKGKRYQQRHLRDGEMLAIAEVTDKAFQHAQMKLPIWIQRRGEPDGWAHFEFEEAPDRNAARELVSRMKLIRDDDGTLFD